MINLLPKDTVFFDLFENLAGHAVTAAEHLRDLLKDYPQHEVHLQKIRDEEHGADQLAHTALERLDRTFITPFDREDIHALIGELDDIIDTIDALAKRLPMFHVKIIEPIFIQQAEVLVQATALVRDAVHRLRKTRKLSDLGDKLIAIHHAESVGDDNHHSAMRYLFDGTVDTLDVLKWKELFDLIEESIDGCEDVGNVLERIVLKNG